MNTEAGVNLIDYLFRGFGMGEPVGKENAYYNKFMWQTARGNCFQRAWGCRDFERCNDLILLLNDVTSDKEQGDE